MAGHLEIHSSCPELGRYEDIHTLRETMHNVLEQTIEWVQRTCRPCGFLCCEEASWYMYNRLYDMGLTGLAIDDRPIIYVIYGYIREPLSTNDPVPHVWVELFCDDVMWWIFDPSTVQFDFIPNDEDYVNRYRHEYL